MTRQQYLWLFVWIFIFFITFCIWSKLQQFTPKTIVNIPTNESTNMHKKEMHFKVIKENSSVNLLGIVSSKDAKNRLIDAYGKVFQEVNYSALQVDENVKKDSLLDFFTNFADNFSHFKSGYLAYSNGSLEIDGVADEKIVQQTLQEQLDVLQDIKVDNKLFIENTVDNSPDDTIPVMEKVTIMTAADVQKSLDKLLEKRRVQFLYARDILTSDSKALVDEISTLLKEHKDIKVEISGHTDSDGTKKNNLRLSTMRANSIKKYLSKKGVDKNRMVAVGHGESQPLVANDTLKNRQINRRVEFKVIGE